MTFSPGLLPNSELAGLHYGGLVGARADFFNLSRSLLHARVLVASHATTHQWDQAGNVRDADGHVAHARCGLAFSIVSVLGGVGRASVSVEQSLSPEPDNHTPIFLTMDFISLSAAFALDCHCEM